MRCESHLTKKAVGYCRGCGFFGCEECLLRAEDGELYCRKCLTALGKKLLKNTVKPREEAIHQKLVVHYQDGTIRKGTAYRLDILEEGFNLVPLTRKGWGKPFYVRFSDLKAIFFVKDFNRAPAVPTGREYHPPGHEVRVFFRDGELLEGYTHSHYTPTSPRFHVIPKNDLDNAYSVIVERAATRRVEIGQMAKLTRSMALKHLVASPLKRKILQIYWRNPQAVVPHDVFCRALGTSPEILEREIEPFISLELFRIEETPQGKQLHFSLPRDKSVRDFIIRRIETLRISERK